MPGSWRGPEGPLQNTLRVSAMPTALDPFTLSLVSLENVSPSAGIFFD